MGLPVFSGENDTFWSNGEIFNTDSSPIFYFNESLENVSKGNTDSSESKFLESDFSLDQDIDEFKLPNTVENENDLWIYEALNLELYLESIYPNLSFSSNVIYEALCLSGNNYEKATEIIMNAYNMVENCRPCRHMLKTKCLRKDCSFDHDVSHIPCRYWMSPVGCSLLKDNQYCPFLHQLSSYDHPYLKTISNTMNHQITKNNPTYAPIEMDFPGLVSSTQPKNKILNASNKSESKLTEQQKLYQAMFGTSLYSNQIGKKKSSANNNSVSWDRNNINEVKSIKLQDNGSNISWVESGTSSYFLRYQCYFSE
jgi:hypothetical protein